MANITYLYNLKNHPLNRWFFRDFYLLSLFFSFKYLFASLKKEMATKIIIIPIGKAAIIDTDCKLESEFSANISAIGNIINTTDQNVLIILLGFSLFSILLYE